MKTLLVTGVTGMLGHYLLRDWMQAGQQIAVVVRDKRHLNAQQRVEQIMRRLEDETGQVLPRPIVFSGDIQQPRMGLSNEHADWVKANCDSILHVAASVKFYADDVPDRLRVEPWLSNVSGTQQTLAACREFGIEHFHHVSTAFVCGVADGKVVEGVQPNARFDNDYAASKAQAEALVRNAAHLKSKTFLRPSIIIGDSRTGFSSGFHGIYTALQLGQLFLIGVLREGLELTPESIDMVIRENFIGQLGLAGNERKNLVGGDWVSRAIREIVINPELHNQTYHLTNPNPVDLPAITNSMRDALLSILPDLSDSSKGVPNELLALDGFKSLMDTYRAYFCSDPQFDSTNTQSVGAIPPCPCLEHETLVKMWKYAINVDFAPAKVLPESGEIHSKASASKVEPPVTTSDQSPSNPSNVKPAVSAKSVNTDFDPANPPPIAIIGMGCRLPGADGLDQFWDLLENGRSAVGELPESFFDRKLYYDPEQGKRGKTYSTIGGLIDSRPLDLDLCPLTQADLQNRDPAHLILCEVAASACRHAGYDPRHIPLPNTGVFIGHSAGSNFGSEIVYASLISETLDYLNEISGFQQLDAPTRESIIADVTARIQQDRPSRDSTGGPHLGSHAAATLIAQTLKLNGPHLVTDAACASSLVAFAIGANAVQRGEVDMALVGGASYNKLESLLLFSQARSCSATGSRPFDDNADGLVSSEGYVVMLIKTLDRAIADGDTIHALVPGLGISTDGRGRSLWAPRKEGQVESMRRAYGEKLDPSRIDFVEAHATSTQIGDATEMQAIAEFLGPKVRPEGLPIGSVKSNIGHTLETAGIAGLLKAILAIDHNKVPPTINVVNPNSTVEWKKLPFRIAHQSEPLPPHPNGQPRRAAVNAFGIGGLNVHVVVDEYTGQSSADYAVSELPLNERDETSSGAQSYSESNRFLHEPIAIIGRGNVLPGAFSVDEFASLLSSDQSMISQAPQNRWRNQIGVQPNATGPRTTPHNAGGFIHGYEFDWLKYRIPPKQIANSNPLQFMLLDSARQALSEAGFSDDPKIDSPGFDRSRTGVIVGTIFGGEFGHQLLIGLRLPETTQRLRERLTRQGMSPDVAERIIDEFTKLIVKNKPAMIDETGSFTSSTLASRVSKELNLMGGAMAIDASECSSMAALNVAVNMLRAGTCEHVLCAGAQRSMDMGNFEPLALQNRLKGSDSANPEDGFVPGEGVAMLLLTPLSKAIAAGNKVLGVIHGVGGGYDGTRNDLAIKSATSRAASAGPEVCDQVKRVSAGAGLPERDAREENFLHEIYAAAKPTDGQKKVINKIGNLMGARGITTLVQETLDPNAIGLTALNDLAQNGQNYQLLLDPNPESIRPVDSAATPVEDQNEHAVCITRFAAPDASLMEAQLDSALAEADATFARCGKAAFDVGDRFRIAIVADSPASLRQKLELVRTQWKQSGARAVLNAKGIFVGDQNQPPRKVAFMFPGQGSQYQGMLKGLLAASAAANTLMQQADQILSTMGSPAFNEIIASEGTVDTDPWITQVSVLLADIFVYTALNEIGLKPDCVCGHSFGEIPALYVAGSLSLRQVIEITRLRTDAINVADISTRIDTGLLSVATTVAVVQQQLEQFHAGRNGFTNGASNGNGHSDLGHIGHGVAERLYITHCNAPEQTVIGGRVDLLDDFEQTLNAQGIASQRLNVPRAFHTPLMQEAANRFADALREVEILAPKLPMISGVDNQFADSPQRIRDNLVRQLVEPVRHVEMVNRLISDGFGLFVEAGPQRVLSALNRQICKSQSVVCIATDNPRATANRDKAMEQLLNVQAMIECEPPAVIEAAETDVTQHPVTTPSIKPKDNITTGTPTPGIPMRSRPAHVTNYNPANHVNSMNHSNGSTKMHSILSFDATLQRKQRLRETAAGQMVPPAAHAAKAAGHSVAIARHDATETRRQRKRESFSGVTTLPAQSFGSQSADTQVGFDSQRFVTPGDFHAADVDRVANDLNPNSGPPSPASNGPSSDVAPLDTPSADTLQQFLIDFIVQETGYPAEIIDIDWEFEADLGIDSIKKAQMFGELREMFDLDSMADAFMDGGKFTLDKFRTLRSVLELLRKCDPKQEWSNNGDPTDAAVEKTKNLTSTSVDPSPFSNPPVIETTPVPNPISADPVTPVKPVTPFPATTVADSSTVITGSGLEHFLIDFVIEQTGYPREIIEMDADFEADLGIDSIKKAQLFGELREHFSLEMKHFESMDRVAFGEIRTIRDVMQFLETMPEVRAQMSATVVDSTPSVSAPNDFVTPAISAPAVTEVSAQPTNESPNAPSQFDFSTESETNPDPNRVTSRYVLRTIPAPIRPGIPVVPEFNGAAIILGVNDAAIELQQRIQSLGREAYCIEPTADHDAAAQRLQEIWNAGPAPHLFIMTPRDSDAQSTGDWQHWKQRRELGVMFPFWFCRDWLQLVQKHELMDDASVVAVISSGGDLGFEQPIHAIEGGGISGLVKSNLIESWVNGFRTTPFKVIDAKPDQHPSVIADAVFRELAAPSYDMEVTWNDGIRSKVQASVEHLPTNELKQPVSRGSHWVCTGGARGITAYVCEELAKRFDLQLSLIGTTPHREFPVEYHSMSDDDLKKLKVSVMTSARDAGQNPIKAWEHAEKEIEIDKSLQQLTAKGIRVRYYACDVADPQALEQVLNQIRRDSGPIDGVLHGAGVGKDSRFENKKPEMVNRCIGAKVDGALALMQATRNDPLKYFVAFGSISGRFGANGHADYSLANEMLAKTVGWYKRQRPEVRSIAFHWHAWGDVGMATKPETRLALEMINMEFMPAVEGLNHLIGELETANPKHEVLITDDRYYRQFFPAETLTPDADIDSSANPRYPLLDRGQHVTRNGRVVAAVPLNPTEDPFLIEHRLDDKPLLPIVIGLELLAEAGARELGTNSCLEVLNVEATNGLRFHSDDVQMVHVTTDHSIQQQVHCELVADFHSRNGHLVEADRPYLNGVVRSFDQNPFAFRPPTPIPDGEWHPVKYPPMGSKFYAGAPLQRLRKIKVAERTAWGRIAAPATVELAGSKQPVRGWLVPSSALDACLFATGLLAWFKIEPGSALPAGIGRLTLGRTPDPGELCIVETTFKRREDRYAWFDFSLYGADGSTIIEAEDYRIVWLSE